MKLLSIIIPVYNVAPYVEACLNSIYQQGIEENTFEIILINDGSTDNSHQIITDIQKQHTNITILSQSNQGLSISRNKGITHAIGKYMIFIDSDDLLVPNSLSCMLKYAQLYDIDITQGKYIKLNNNDIEKADYNIQSYQLDSQNIKLQIKNGEKAFIENYSPYESYAWINLFKRDFILKNSLFFIEHKYFEDIAFTVNSLLKARRFLALPVVFYIYRQRESSIMSTMSTTKLYSMNDMTENIYRLLNSNMLSNLGKEKLKHCIFTNISVNLWYLSHYKCLYPHRKEIINDLKQKIPDLSFHQSLKQLFVNFCLKYIPSLYISLRYYFTLNKY